jgi:glycosyltransferase involved in cell wall biosynthesis
MTPDFSIVIETENLESAGQRRLLEALDSLAQQTISPKRARQVVLINSGLIEPSVAEAIHARFPWVIIHTAGEPVDYYAAKGLGVALTTGEVIVFFDCDVHYEPRWLESILEIMFADSNAEVVTGETSLNVSGPYTLAVLLAWAFPPLEPARPSLRDNRVCGQQCGISAPTARGNSDSARDRVAARQLYAARISSEARRRPNAAQPAGTGPAPDAAIARVLPAALGRGLQ